MRATLRQQFYDLNSYGHLPKLYLPIGIMQRNHTPKIEGMAGDEDFDRKDFLTRLGAQIAKQRAAKGYSQDRLCLEAGFARGTLSKIENGLVDPQASTLARIAETIGVPLRKLLDL